MQADRGLTQDEIEAEAERLLADQPKLVETLEDSRKLISAALRHMSERSLIRQVGDVWEVTPAERDIVAYYANTVVHFFDQFGYPTEGFKISARAKS